MAEIKNTFLKSKMNKDLDSRIIGNGEYRDARNAGVSASEDASVGSLENIRGNQLISLLGVDTFDNFNIEVIGQYSDVANNRMFFFLTNFSDASIDSLSNTSEESDVLPPATGNNPAPGTNFLYSFNKKAANHYICYCQLPNTRSSSEINITNVKTQILVSGTFLNFSKTHPITGINIIENLLFFTDNRNQPRKINIETAILNPFISVEEPGYYYSEDHISVAKYAPYSAISFIKNFNGVEEGTLINETEEWLPPFFAAPAYRERTLASSSTQLDYLQFDDMGGCVKDSAGTGCLGGTPGAVDPAVEDLPSYVWGYVYGGSVNPPTANLGVKIQPAYDSSSDYAFFDNAGAYNKNAFLDSRSDTGRAPQQVLVKTESNIITDFDTLAGWPDQGKATVFNFSIRNPNYNPFFLGDKKFLEDKLARFSYRFKYEDNEYSLTAPFSQHAFIPKQFGYFLTGDDNRTKDSSTVDFMENQITTAELVMDLPFSPNDIVNKLKVKEIQILYKASDDQNVKIVQDIDISNPDNQLGCPKSFTVEAAGSLYPPGKYKQVPLIGGTGTKLLADINVSNQGTITSSTNFPTTVSTGSLIFGVVPGFNLENTIIGAAPNMSAIISPITTGAGPGNYTPASARSASFRISTDSSGSVDSVEVFDGGSSNPQLNGGGGYVNGDILTFNLSGVLSTANLGGDLKLTVSQSLIAPNMSGSGYKVNDVLTVPPLPLARIGSINSFVAGTAVYEVGKVYALSASQSIIIPATDIMVLCNSTDGNGTIQFQGTTLIPDNTTLYLKNEPSVNVGLSSFTYNIFKSPAGSLGKLKIESLTNSFTYKYSSEKPIKVLTSEEVTRVSDIVPMRAQTQEVVGNRVVYGNFLQNKSTPSIKYKLSTQFKGLGNSSSALELNNSTLKQGRSYQVGVVLQDRYGRASNVIINNNNSLNSTFFAPYSNAGTNPLSWLGNSLKITFEDGISSSFSPDGNGFYSETNPLGWYTYKVVVQQQEQDYYNVYTPGALSGNIIYTSNAKIDPQDADATVETPLEYGETNEIFQIALFNDNINKIPRELKEVGNTDNIFSSNVVLYNRVNNSNFNSDSGSSNDQNLSTQNKQQDTVKQEVNTVRAFKELGEWTNYKNINLHFLKMDPNPSATPRSQYSNPTFIYPGAEGEIDPFYLKNNQNPLIATVSTKKRMGFSKSNQESTNFNFAKSLMVFETKPFKSTLDIYYETSTSGLITKLNEDIALGIDPTGEGVIGDLDGVSVTTWLETTQANEIITNEFTAQDLNGNPLGSTSSQYLSIEITNVTTSNNVQINNYPFEIVQAQAASLPFNPPTFYIKLLQAGVSVFDANSNVNDSYFVTLTATVNDPSITTVQTFNKTINLSLSNVEPEIYRIQGFGNQLAGSDFQLGVGAYFNRNDILNNFLRANINGDNGFSKIVTAGFPDRTGSFPQNTTWYEQQMNAFLYTSPNPWDIKYTGTQGVDVGYVSHFTNGFKTIQPSIVTPGYQGNKENDAFYYDSSSSLSTQDQLTQEMYPDSRRDVEAVVHKVVKYNAYWEGKNGGLYGAKPPRLFAGFVPRGWYNGGINDPKAQIGYGGDLDARLANDEFKFVNSGTQIKSIISNSSGGVFQAPSKDVMLLRYVGPNGDTIGDTWHNSLSRFWWAAWYYQVQIKLRDASNNTGTLSSETYYINVLVGNTSKIPN